MTKYVFGIDFGSTYSTIARLNEDSGEAEERSGEDAPSTPSDNKQ